MVAWGVKGRMSPSSGWGASKPFRTDSVVEIMKASGPAAATRPLWAAMLRRDAVGEGAGFHFEVSCTLDSPLSARKPRPWWNGELAQH